MSEDRFFDSGSRATAGARTAYLTPERREAMVRQLRFPPPWEAEFQNGYFRSIRPIVRGGFLVGAVLTLIALLRDLYLLPGGVNPLPYLLVAAAMLVVFAATYFPIERFWQPCGVAVASLLSAIGYAYVADLYRDIPIVVTIYQSAVLIVVFSLGRLQFLWLVVFILLNCLIETLTMHLHNGLLWNDVLRMEFAPFAEAILLMLAAYFQERTARGEFLAGRLLEEEHLRAEALLSNILPLPIVRRLKEGAEEIADPIEEVTVLFADIVGFTPLSTRLTALQIVRLLDDVFCAFDEIAERYGVEKIRTIGDGYMAVAGAPEPKEDHVAAVTEMALGMGERVSEIAERLQLPLRVRIGIHTGPVVAGVIGRKRLLYDLWSDTVNVASRMESQGEPGRIQVTEPVYQAVADRYRFTEPCEIEVKGRGTMRTRFLEGRLGKP